MHIARAAALDSRPPPNPPWPLVALLGALTKQASLLRRCDPHAAVADGPMLPQRRQPSDPTRRAVLPPVRAGIHSGSTARSSASTKLLEQRCRPLDVSKEEGDGATGEVAPLVARQRLPQGRRRPAIARRHPRRHGNLPPRKSPPMMRRRRHEVIWAAPNHTTDYYGGRLAGRGRRVARRAAPCRRLTRGKRTWPANERALPDSRAAESLSCWMQRPCRP